MRNWLKPGSQSTGKTNRPMPSSLHYQSTPLPFKCALQWETKLSDKFNFCDEAEAHHSPHSRKYNLEPKLVQHSLDPGQGLDIKHPSPRSEPGDTSLMLWIWSGATRAAPVTHLSSSVLQELTSLVWAVRRSSSKEQRPNKESSGYAVRLEFQSELLGGPWKMTQTCSTLVSICRICIVRKVTQGFLRYDICMDVY